MTEGMFPLLKRSNESMSTQIMTCIHPTSTTFNVVCPNLNRYCEFNLSNKEGKNRTHQIFHFLYRVPLGIFWN